jgi:hypothetical protein
LMAVNVGIDKRVSVARFNAVDDILRESSDTGSSDRRIGLRTFVKQETMGRAADRADRRCDVVVESLAQTGLAVLVPESCAKNLGLGFRQYARSHGCCRSRIA